MVVAVERVRFTYFFASVRSEEKNRWENRLIESEMEHGAFDLSSIH